jgi:hypothetical protein
MKKPLLILLCLIGLSAFNQASAQNDLDIENTTGCSFNVSAGEIDPIPCIPGTSSTTPVPGGAVFTVPFSGAPYVVNKFYVKDCTGTNGVALWDFTMCGGGNNLFAVLPASACCPSGASIKFVPATPGTNALIYIF